MPSQREDKIEQLMIIFEHAETGRIMWFADTKPEGEIQFVADRTYSNIQGRFAGIIPGVDNVRSDA